MHPEHFRLLRLWYDDEQKDCTCFLYWYRAMTYAAVSVNRAILNSKHTISRFDREGPIYNKLLISLINRVHKDRNRLFHFFISR